MTATTERLPPRIATPRRPRAQGRHADLGRVRIALAERDRMARFSALVAELEQVPPSPARDALVVTVRSRAVALETGAAAPSGWRETKRPSAQAATSAAIAAELGCSATAASPRLVRRGRIEHRARRDDSGAARQAKEGYFAEAAARRREECRMRREERAAKRASGSGFADATAFDVRVEVGPARSG
jgi:hypothetical protein